MSRPRAQLVLVLALLPLGLGLCVFCLSEDVTALERPQAKPATAAGLEIMTSPGHRAGQRPPAAPLEEPGPPATTTEGGSPTLRRRSDRPQTNPVQGPARRDSARRGLIARVRNRSLGERDRLAAIVALAAEGAAGAGEYVPEVFRARFPEQSAAPRPIADFETRRTLTEALRYPEATVAERALLVAALGPSQDYPDVASALREAFSDPSAEVRGQVVLELAATAEPAARDLLQRAAADPSLEVRVRAVLVLGADPAQQPFLEAAYDAEGQARDVKAAIVVQASEHASTRQGGSFLTRVLRDETDPRLRDEALAALAVAAEVDPAGLRAATGPELPQLLRRAHARAGVSASADAERILELLQAR